MIFDDRISAPVAHANFTRFCQDFCTRFAFPFVQKSGERSNYNGIILTSTSNRDFPMRVGHARNGSGELNSNRDEWAKHHVVVYSPSKSNAFLFNRSIGPLQRIHLTFVLHRFFRLLTGILFPLRYLQMNKPNFTTSQLSHHVRIQITQRSQIIRLVFLSLLGCILNCYLNK